MSVRVSLIQLFMCLNQAGLPFLMSYDQRTGRLEPVFATFLPASGFEPVPYCQPKALSDSTWYYNHRSHAWQQPSLHFLRQCPIPYTPPSISYFYFRIKKEKFIKVNRLMTSRALSMARGHRSSALCLAKKTVPKIKIETSYLISYSRYFHICRKQKNRGRCVNVSSVRWALLKEFPIQFQDFTYSTSLTRKTWTIMLTNIP
jgi:hypothetical protein